MVSTLVKLPGLKDEVDLHRPIVPHGHFFWYEALHGGSRLPEGPNVTRGIVLLAEALEPLRRGMGKPIIVTSWLRTPESNRAVGGASNSSHLTGKAIDCYCPFLNIQEFGEYVNPRWTGGLGFYSTHLHLDIWPYRRWWG